MKRTDKNVLIGATFNGCQPKIILVRSDDPIIFKRFDLPKETVINLYSCDKFIIDTIKKKFNYQWKICNH